MSVRPATPGSAPVEILPDVWLLKGFADTGRIAVLLEALLAAAPLRHMHTPRGFRMSVAMSNCGTVGWVSDGRGYRYSERDPLSGAPWPAMPTDFRQLAAAAAGCCGFAAFWPDACLINRYTPGSQMGAHQDRDERDFSAPIVSVSAGIPARFFVIGAERRGRSTPVDLEDGDVVVFGASARRHYHGVRKLKPAHHPVFGAVRFNLTFRKAR